VQPACAGFFFSSVGVAVVDAAGSRASTGTAADEEMMTMATFYVRSDGGS